MPQPSYSKKNLNQSEKVLATHFFEKGIWTKSRVTTQSCHTPSLDSMSRPSHHKEQIESVCPECCISSKLSVDIDHWLACNHCGLQIEPAEKYASDYTFNEFDSEIQSGVGHGDATGIGRKLIGSEISGNRDYAGNNLSQSWQNRGRFRARLDRQSRADLEGTRARRDTMRMIREATRQNPTLQREALFNFSAGWPEPKNRSADFKTIAHAGHPTPRSSSAAACIFVASERIGIRIPAHQLINQFFDVGNISFGEAKKYLLRSIKCLRNHLGYSANQEAVSNRLDGVLNSALSRDTRLGSIFNQVRKFCHFWAEIKGNSRVLDAPGSYAACAAYEIGKIEGIGMTLDDIQVAFEVSQGFRTRQREVQELLAFKEEFPEVVV